MSSCTFYLDKRNGREDKPCIIFAKISVGSFSLKYNFPIKIKVLPIHWDQSKQKIKNGATNYKDGNILLSKISSETEFLHKRLTVINPNFNENDFRSELNLSVFPNVVAQKNTAVKKENNPMLCDYINVCCQKIAKGNDKSNLDSNINIRKFTLRHLQLFFKHKGYGDNYDIEISKIDFDFFYDMESYLVHTACLSPNSVSQVFLIIKATMNILYNEGVTQNDVHKRVKLSRKLKSSNSLKLYLTESELKKIYMLKDEILTPLEIDVRDSFIIGCYTGLRFSDYSVLEAKNLHNGLITIITKKTNTKVFIPIHNIIKDILSKRNGIPPTATYDHFRKILPKLGKLAGLDEMFEKTTIKGVIKTNIQVKKYELISTHTARRSFATNAYLSGVPTFLIMSILGMKTEAVLMKYINISAEELAENSKNHKFFLQ